MQVLCYSWAKFSLCFIVYVYKLLCVQAHSLSIEHVPVHVYVCNIQDHHCKVDLFSGLHMFVMYVLGKGHVHRPFHICKEGLNMQ